MSTKRTTTRMLCEGAVLAALALILGLFKLYELPQAGSVSLEMLPLLLFCLRWGVGPGALTCTAFGVLQVFVQSAVAYGWLSILLDYVLAFSVLCVAGLGKGRPGGVFWGTVLGCLARFAVHFLSGITIYRIVAPTELFGTVFDRPALYSAVYNGSYMGIDLLLCLILFSVLYPTMRPYLTGEDLR